MLLSGLLFVALAANGLVAQQPFPSTQPTLPPTALLEPTNSNQQAYTSSPIDVRIKDISYLEGRRRITLSGYGLVAGLNGTGGKSPATRQAALSVAESRGIRADPTLRAVIRNSTQDKTNNLSVVFVSADVDNLKHRIGNTVDVTVAAVDDASSLQGGYLIPMTLTAIDGEAYASANGMISLGGFNFTGDAASVQKNHPTVGRIANGATIEQDICKSPFVVDGRFRLNLLNPDLETAVRVAKAVDQFWTHHAQVIDPATIEVIIPKEYSGAPEKFIALVDSMRVTPDQEAIVVINERTGTIVVGENVRISRVAVTHANLAVITVERPRVSQPAALSRGVTAVVPDTSIDVVEEKSPVNLIDQPPTVGELARALNALGVAPRDLGSIFQMLKQSGALQARLELQ